MTEQEYNPNDLAFLASRGLDETLSDADQARLRTACQNDAAFDANVQGLRAVDSLVRAWGESGADVAPDNFVESVLGRIADDHDEHHGGVDQLLGNWTRESPSVDERRFVDAVQRRVQRERGKHHARPLLHRLGLPLTAAAAIAMALSAGLWFQAERRPVIRVSIGRMVEGGSAARSPGQRTSRVVLFDRTPVGAAKGSAVGADESFGVIGADPVVRYAYEAPPI